LRWRRSRSGDRGLRCDKRNNRRRRRGRYCRLRHRGNCSDRSGRHYCGGRRLQRRRCRRERRLYELGRVLHARQGGGCNVSVRPRLYRLAVFVIEIENDSCLSFFRARRCGGSIFVAATTASATASAATPARTVTGVVGVTRGGCGRSRCRDRCCDCSSRRQHGIELRLFDSRRRLWPTLALGFAALRLILRRG
jgi:hypothetical protein